MSTDEKESAEDPKALGAEAAARATEETSKARAAMRAMLRRAFERLAAEFMQESDRWA
jgi:Arc/MetJ family transcription regulator